MPKTAASVKAKTSAKEKPKVEVHAGLSTLLKQHDEAASKAASYLVDVCELVMKDNISNPVLIKTIMEARGTNESSAKSQASRIRGFIKNKEQFQALKDGDITVRAAVKGTAAARVPTQANKQKRFDSTLTNFIEAAKALGQDKESILATVEGALDKANVK
jgi:hypothetical protein